MAAPKRQSREGAALRDRIIDTIDEYAWVHGASPNRSELARILGVTRKAVTYQTKKLIAEGRLIDGPGQRGLRVLRF